MVLCPEHGVDASVSLNCCSDPARAVRLGGAACGMASVGACGLLGVTYASAFDSSGYRFIFLTTAVTNSARLMEAMSEVKA